MAHSRSDAADALLDQKIGILDHGFVRLVDYMGGDDRIVQSARVSYGAGTKTVREDKALIAYLMRNQHTSPFEQVVLTFHIKAPIFIVRQWVRHRTARMNELSGRYSVLNDECYLPAADDVRFQSQTNRQGRSDEIVSDELRQAVLNRLAQGQQMAFEDYQLLLDKNIARELARINLPLSTYTEFYWQIDLNNLFHFLQLRLHSHAQKEIRVYAEVLAQAAKAVAPYAYEAFEEHVLNAVRFSASEMKALHALLRGDDNPLSGRALELFEEKLRKN